MTTYEGRRAGYVPGMQPVNKEPPVGKYVVEKLYKVHRERLLKVTPLVDCHVNYLDFLQDTSWKQTAALHRETRLMSLNEEMYERLSKLENQEGTLKKEQKEHVKNVCSGGKIMKRLKDNDRRRKVVAIQKENEHMHSRIERARAEYTIEHCKEWYKYHAMFKDGRRSDVTGGHLMNIPKKLKPKKLPALHHVSDSCTFSQGSLSGSYTSSSIISKSLPIMSPINNKAKSMSLEKGRMSTGFNTLNLVDDDNSVFFDVEPGTFGSSDSPNPKRFRKMASSPEPFAGASRNSEVDGVQSVTSPHASFRQSFRHGSKVAASSSPQLPNIASPDKPLRRGGDVSTKKPSSMFSKNFVSSMQHNFSLDDEKSKEAALASSLLEGSIVEETDEGLLIMIGSRVIPLPLGRKTCEVQTFITEEYSEKVIFRIMSMDNRSGAAMLDEDNNPPDKKRTVISERVLHLDYAFSLQSSLCYMPQATISEDVTQLRTLLANMFREADVDHSGTLSFEEFHSLMERIDLGITSQELRFVISEADENADGIVVYEEFLPIAVDIISTFKARMKAKKSQTENEEMIDDAVNKALQSNDEIARIAKACMEKLRLADPKKTGVIRVSEVRRRLFASGAGLSAVEINMICQSLPRDTFGRCEYATFRDVLYDVRFVFMKNMIIESQGSKLQDYLMDICKKEENRIREEVGDDMAIPGMILFRNLVSAMIKSPRLSLSRLQVMVIVSEAEVVDGMVNYHKFVPVAAKAIEAMFEPGALKLRSELLENTDMSTISLSGETEEEFQKRLTILFQSYDINHDGDLDTKEFISCIESLNFNLSPGEIFALMATADVDHSGTVSFDEFARFCTYNLLHLEKAKRLREAQKLDIGVDLGEVDKRKVKEQEEFEAMFCGHLLAIFQEADRDGNGFLDPVEIQELLRSLHIDISQYQLDVLVSEMDSNGDGCITYAEFIPVCAQLLQVFRARSSSKVNVKAVEKAANRQAIRLAEVYYSDIQTMAALIFEKMNFIFSNLSDSTSRRVALSEVLHNQHTGLCRTEANMLLAKMCPSVDKLGQEQKTIMDDDDVPNDGGGSVGTGHEYTEDQIRHLVKRVRETSLKRMILDPLVAKEIEADILAKFTDVARADRPTEDSPVSSFISICACYEILAKSAKLRLCRFQILHIISWADLFEGGSTMINYAKFAPYVAEKVVWLTSPDTTAARAETMDHLEEDEDWCQESYVNGLTEDMFQEHCRASFQEIVDEHGHISESQFCEVISSIPLVNLSDPDTLAIVSSFPRVSGKPNMIAVSDFTPWGYETVMMVCQERILGRRIWLLETLKAVSDAEAAEFAKKDKEGINKELVESSTEEHQLITVDCPLVSLFNKLLEVAKLIPHMDSFVLTFPNEKQHLSKIASGKGSPGDTRDRRNSPDKHRMTANINRSLSSGDGRESEREEESLFSNIISLSVFKQIPKVPDKRSMTKSGVARSGVGGLQLAPSTSIDMTAGLPMLGSPPHGAGGSSRETSREGTAQLRDDENVVDMKRKTHTETVIQAAVKIYMGVAGNGFEKILLADITGISDESICLKATVLPVKLPSIALVDSDTAIQFAENLADLLAIRYSVASVSRSVSPIPSKGLASPQRNNSRDMSITYSDCEIFLNSLE